MKMALLVIRKVKADVSEALTPSMIKMIVLITK